MKRREVTGAFLCAAGLWPGRAVFAAEKDNKPTDQPKATQAAARYQDKPKDIQSCGLCSLFLAPDGCKVVEGKVIADGWCALFDQVD